jgi:hypothetical protein
MESFAQLYNNISSHITFKYCSKKYYKVESIVSYLMVFQNPLKNGWLLGKSCYSYTSLFSSLYWTKFFLYLLLLVEDSNKNYYWKSSSTPIKINIQKEIFTFHILLFIHKNENLMNILLFLCLLYFPCYTKMLSSMHCFYCFILLLLF